MYSTIPLATCISSANRRQMHHSHRATFTRFAPPPATAAYSTSKVHSLAHSTKFPITTRSALRRPMPLEPIVLATTLCTTVGAIIVATSWERITRIKLRPHRHRGPGPCRRPKWLPRPWRDNPYSSSSGESIGHGGSHSGSRHSSEHIYGAGDPRPWRDSGVCVASSIYLQDPTTREFQSMAHEHHHGLRRTTSTPLLTPIPEESSSADYWNRPLAYPSSSMAQRDGPNDPRYQGSINDAERPSSASILREGEAFAEQLAGLERQVIQDRIDALRRSITYQRVQSRLADIEKLAGLSSSNAEGIGDRTLRRTASIGPGVTSGRETEWIGEQLREVAASILPPDESVPVEDSS